MENKIFVCTYDQPCFFENDIFTPLQVGKGHSGVDLNILADNTGDNISNMNKYYSEESGLYWVWKNYKGLDKVGFCHFRKILLLDRESKKGTYQMTKREFLDSFDMDNVRKRIDNSDVILANPIGYACSLSFAYEACHIPDDLKILQELIYSKYPAYTKAWNEYMNNKPSLFFPYNIFVMKWEIFDEYCNFIFSIFKDLEKILDLEHHCGYQSRVFGYMSERLLGVFLLHYDYAIKMNPVVMISDYFTQERITWDKSEMKKGMEAKLNIHNGKVSSII